MCLANPTQIRQKKPHPYITNCSKLKKRKQNKNLRQRTLFVEKQLFNTTSFLKPLVCNSPGMLVKTKICATETEPVGANNLICDLCSSSL